MWQLAKVDGEQVKVFRVPKDFSAFPSGVIVMPYGSGNWMLQLVDGSKTPIYADQWIINDGRKLALRQSDIPVEILPQPEPRNDTPLIFIQGQFKTDTIEGTIYHFKEGEGLPVHVHPMGANNHITVVAKGRLICSGRPAIEGKIIGAGQVLDWMPNEPHGFKALEDSIIVQVRKT